MVTALTAMQTIAPEHILLPSWDGADICLTRMTTRVWWDQHSSAESWTEKFQRDNKNETFRVMSGRIKVMTVSRTLLERVPTHLYNWLFSDIIPPTKCYPWWGPGLSTDIIVINSSKFPSDSLTVMVPVYILDIQHKQHCFGECPNRHLSTPLFGHGTEMTTSRLDQTGRSRILELFPLLPREHGFHFGIGDTGNLGSIKWFYFYRSTTHLVKNEKRDWSTILSLFVPPCPH